ncbi:MAG: sigma-70 family RNA polymerase sigma factor [Phycisphaerales bacterium]|nr:sigma-70 family RNA polymerase sigma factor [Phycisphaerales bacterium]
MTNTPDSVAQTIELIAVSGPDSFARVTLPIDAEGCLIGRAPTSTVQLNDPSVSRSHARIHCADGKVLVSDLGSRCGTSVNMMRLEEEEDVSVADRDILMIGPWKLLVRFEGEATEDESADETSEASDAVEPKPVEPAPPSEVKGGRGDPLYATRASIFMKLKADGTVDREVGWNEFAEKYSRVIAGFARNAGLPAQEADDVLQDVLLGFFRVAERFEYDPKRGRFRGYLKRVTLNAIRARHRRKRPTTGFADTVEPPVECDLDAAWDRQWTEQILQRAMAEAREEVEDRTWRSFELYGVRGVPVEQVAAETGMTASAIRHAKMRLTRRVREIVTRFRDEEG